MRGAWCVVWATAVLAAGCGGGREPAEVVSALRDTLAAKERPAYVTRDAEGRRLWKLTRAFYERRDFEPAWIDGNDPRRDVGELIAAIQASAEEGLDPDLYNARLLEARWRQARSGFIARKGFYPSEAGSFDVWFTYLYMKYASDLADGLSDLAHADPAWRIEPEKFDPAAHLEGALERKAVGRSLNALAPDNPQYRALRDALASYRAQAAAGGWPAVPRRLTLKPRARGPHVGLLARRLAASGDYSGPAAAPGQPAVYGPELQEAVRRFQRRHGLHEDGVVGPAVAAELNVPVEKRIAQIALNLERWRWLPRSLGDRYVMVNIPEYRLEVWEGSRVSLEMRVVVGHQDTPTPIFNDEMTHLVFSPYWNVPPGIAEGETLPEILKDPGFLARNNMEVLDAGGRVIDPLAMDLSDPTIYRFRQRPGSGNSLGLVKFMFPNEFNVYLHDTPAGSLFARVTRSFSHGCVRLEQPAALAAYVLADRPEWTPERIREAMQAGEERTVKLRRPLPVYLGYFTARASADGLVQFRRDVYGIDRQQTTLLADRLSRLRRSAAAAVRAAAASANSTD